MVSDASNANVPLDRRGEGLRWFLAMLVQMEHQKLRDGVLANLFLIDEPGVFLHPAGQSDLHAIFNRLSEENSNQVIYSTHSPFMLDWARPHQIRIVERDKQTRASVIVDKPYHSNEVLNFWEPFRRSIGLFLGDLGLLGEKNLLVEGPTDQMILAHLARTTGKLADWRIIPFGNNDALALIARTCKQAKRAVAVLVDGDGGGADHFEALRKHDCADIPIHSLLEFNPRPMEDIPFCIEEFLSTRQYLAAVNDAYGDFPWYKPVEEADLPDTREPLAARLEALFDNRAWSDGKPHRFTKAYVAIQLASARRPITLRNLGGDFAALGERLAGIGQELSAGTAKERRAPFPPIALGVIEATAGDQHDWWCIFSLVVARDRGVKSITVVADGQGQRIQLAFPPGSIPVATPAAPEVPQNEPAPEPDPDTDAATEPPNDDASGEELLDSTRSQQDLGP